MKLKAVLLIVVFILSSMAFGELKKAPDFKLKDMKGKKVELKDIFKKRSGTN